MSTLWEELLAAAQDARYGLGEMTSPSDAHWVTIEVNAGEVTCATLVVAQNVSWTVEVNDRIYTGHYC